MDELVGWTVMDWAAEKHAQGARYAMFTPGQFRSMIADLISAEVDGRLFAGEATSVHHAWIVGSLNSAYRAVDEILCREGLVEKRIELRNLWGSCDESVAELDGSLLGPALEARGRRDRDGRGSVKRVSLLVLVARAARRSCCDSCRFVRGQ